MNSKKITSLTSIAALTVSFFTSTHAYAAAECPMIPQADVIKAFNDPKARMDFADPSGMCSFSLSNGGSMTATVQKRPKASEAKAIYDSYKATTFAALKRNASTPAVGQEAYFGMSAKDANPGEAGFISLQGDSLFVISYRANGKIDDSVAESVLTLGRIGSGKKDNAAQSYGECEWFTAAEVTTLLGKGKPTVQRLAANHCIASANPGGSALVGMTSKHGTKESLGNIMASSTKICTVVPLPQLGANAHASFACKAPANTAMSINFVKNGTHVMMIYTPPNRAAVESDIKALEVVTKRAFDRF